MVYLLPRRTKLAFFNLPQSTKTLVVEAKVGVPVKQDFLIRASVNAQHTSWGSEPESDSSKVHVLTAQLNCANNLIFWCAATDLKQRKRESSCLGQKLEERSGTNIVLPRRRTKLAFFWLSQSIFFWSSRRKLGSRGNRRFRFTHQVTLSTLLGESNPSETRRRCMY